MEVVVMPTTEAAIELTAQLIAKEVNAKPDAVLGLATGRTMEAVYARVAEMNKAGDVDFSLVRSFNLDEYIGLEGTNENSYRFYMNQHLFKNINIDIRNTNVPNGMAEDLVAEGIDYDDKIDACGGLDMQLLGIGRSGHIGFNEPLSSFASGTRPKCLTPTTVEQNAPLFTDGSEMPKRAMTMGVGTILGARKLLLLATGAEKADIVAKAVEGPMTSMISATALQMHPHALVIVDAAAASKLTERAYYDFIFETEPHWAEFHDLKK